MGSKTDTDTPSWLKIRQKGRAAVLAALPGILIVAISLTRTLISSEIYQQHEQDNMTVNLLGRQRMLSQKYLKEVLLSTWKLQTPYKTTRAVLDETAHSLAEGGWVTASLKTGQRIHIQPVTSPKLRQRLDLQIRQMAVLERETQALSVAIERNRVTPAQLGRIMEEGNNLLYGIDETLAQFQLNSENGIKNRLYEESMLGMLVSLLGLYVTNQILRSNKALKQEIDIRKIAEAKLRLSEARFRSAFDSAYIGMGLCRREDGKWLEVNQPFCDMLGYTREEMLSMTYRDITHPDDLAADHEYERLLGEKTLENFHYEKRYLHKAGQVVWVFLSGSLVFGEDHQPLYYVTQIQNITLQKQAQEALKESSGMLRSLVQSASAAIILADDQGAIRLWNTAAEAMFGYSESEMLGEPITRLMPEQYRATYQRGMQRQRMGGRLKLPGKTTEQIGIRKNGEAFPLELSLASWKTEKHTFFSGMIRDISEKKRYEREIQKLSSRNRQLKNQLTGYENP